MNNIYYFYDDDTCEISEAFEAKMRKMLYEECKKICKRDVVMTADGNMSGFLITQKVMTEASRTIINKLKK